MRSVFAIGSAAWFLFMAITIGDGSAGTIGDPPYEEVIGNEAAMAVHHIARILFVGLALLALVC